MVTGSDGHFYCTADTAGYCDRRSGACFCYDGYTGDDCSQCEVAFYRNAASGLCEPRSALPAVISRTSAPAPHVTVPPQVCAQMIAAAGERAIQQQEYAPAWSIGMVTTVH